MFIELNGVTHHYTSTGEGPPVVLVHGLGGSLHVWGGVTAGLEAGHHVVALDLRGHGRSGTPKGGLSIESLAGDVEALIGALELPAVTLVGHSMGSLIAQQLAVSRPHLVDALVLVGGISHFEPEQRKAYRERADLVERDGLDAIVDDWLAGALSQRTHGSSPELVGLLRDVMLRNDPATYAKACRAIAEVEPVDRERIGQPTLLVTADRDRSTPLAMAEELHRQIPVSTVRVLAGAGHWCQLERADELASMILEFLT